MSSFSAGQLNQLGDALQAAGYSADDVTRLGQAGVPRLSEIRESLRTSDIIEAIEAGRTELWLHEDQKVRWTSGRVIYAHLKETGLLGGCVTLAELKTIQAKGIDFFRQHFAGKAIFGWVFQVDSVPYLYGFDDEVILDWIHLDLDWGADDPALRRK